MNYYYDPILGLKYTYLGETVILDIDCLSKDVNFDIHQWLKYFKEVGVQLCSSSSQPCVESFCKITDYNI